MELKIKKSALVVLFIAAIFIFALLLLPLQEKKPLLAPEDITAPINCSSAQIGLVWNKIFNEDITDAKIVNESASNNRCTKYLAIKTGPTSVRLLAGESTENTIRIEAIYSNDVKQDYLNILNSVTSIANLSLIEITESTTNPTNYYSWREISLSDANRIYHTGFKIPEGTWETTQRGNQTIYKFNRDEASSSVQQTIFGFVSGNYSLDYTSISSGCLPNWTLYYTNCSAAETKIKYFIDKSNCGITATGDYVNKTEYCDYGNDGRIGSESNIQTSSNFNKSSDFEVLIDGDEKADWARDYGEELVEIYYDDELIAEFDWDFEDEPLNFYEIKFQRQSSSKKYGYLIIEGINAEKTVYVDKKNSTSSMVCVDDSADSENDISDDCDKGAEEIVICPGSAGDIDCEIDGSYFKVSGLEHSGVTEFLGSPPATICTPVWTYGAWGACDATGHQTRTATDSRNCGTTTGRQAITQACPYVAPAVCIPNWQEGPWTPAECPKNGKQTRTVTDLNSCGTTANKPPQTQDCEPDNTTMIIIIVIAVLIVILIIAIIALLILRGRSGSEPNIAVLTRPASPPPFSPPGQMNRPGPPAAMPGQISRPMSMIQPYRRI